MKGWRFGGRTVGVKVGRVRGLGNGGASCGLKPQFLSRCPDSFLVKNALSLLLSLKSPEIKPIEHKKAFGGHAPPGPAGEPGAYSTFPAP